jgi:hypothetical protein
VLGEGGGVYDLGNQLGIHGTKKNQKESATTWKKIPNNSNRSESDKKQKNGGAKSIKGAHGGSVIWICAEERSKGRRRGHAWERKAGRSRRI